MIDRAVVFGNGAIAAFLADIGRAITNIVFFLINMIFP